MTAIRYEGDPVTVATETGTGFVMEAGEHDIVVPELLAAGPEDQRGDSSPGPGGESPGQEASPGQA